MVTITNGKRILVVSKGAFKSLYARKGWEIFSGEENTEEKVKTPENAEICSEESEEYDEPDECEDAPVEDEEVSVPLSEMTVAELKAFAKDNDIDISGAKTASDIRSIIEAEMEE